MGSYKTESTSPSGLSTTEGTRGPTSTTEGSTSTMIGQTTPKPTWPTLPTGQTITWTHGTGSFTLTTGPNPCMHIVCSSIDCPNGANPWTQPGHCCPRCPTGSTSGPGSTSSIHTTTRSYVPSTTTTE